MLPSGNMDTVSADVLSLRALNRATLERQLLLRRSALPILEAVDHLVGLQAQVPLDPYLALWSRLEGFRPEELGQLLLDRAVVRIVVMRGTIHLVTAEDCLELRPLVQPVLDQELARHAQHAPGLVGVDLAPALAFARELLAEAPRTGTQLRAALAERFPALDSAALAYACRNHLALVQVPPRGVWGRSGQVTSTTAEAWLGRPTATEPSLEDVLLRYLGAFGPATVADMTAWSRLTGLREVAERIRPHVRAFRDERGRELLDLPDAPHPDPDTPAPTRFLPEYDNVLLSHQDRARFAFDPGGPGAPAPPESVKVHGTVLHDGLVRATWHVERDPSADAVTLHLRLIGRLAKRAVSAIEAEGRRMLAFREAAVARHDVQVVAPT
jgi:hypothetical protein